VLKKQTKGQDGGRAVGGILSTCKLAAMPGFLLQYEEDAQQTSAQNTTNIENADRQSSAEEELERCTHHGSSSKLAFPFYAETSAL